MQFQSTLMGCLSSYPLRYGIGVAVVALAVANPKSQTSISGSLNNFTAAEDVALGREAAQAVMSHLTTVSDPHVSGYVSALGTRLITAIPPQLARPIFFQQAVTVLNVRDVTSFTVPGGPVFISRQMIELAGSEDALAALIAHEIAHVVLRHATAQLSASEPHQIGAISGRQVGLAAANPFPGLLERGVTFSIASYFFRFGNALEAEAHEVGARIVAEAGFDPDAMRDMIGAIYTRGAAHGGLAWLARHPGTLNQNHVHDGPGSSPEFEAIQARLRSIPLPERRIGNPPVGTQFGTVGAHVPPPSGEDRVVTAGDTLLLSVPASWDRLVVGNSVIFAPDGAYLSLRDGPAAITHGIEIGIARSLTDHLERDMPLLLTALANNNTRLTWTPAFSRVRVSGHEGMTTTATNVSAVTGEFESTTVTSFHFGDGTFVYFLTVAPQHEAATYRGVFDRVVRSLRIVD